jgi:Fe-Mn family superoxide dismutase
MYQMINLDYSLSSLYPYLNYNVLSIHYNNIYSGYVYYLNKLLKKEDYHYNYTPKELIKNIDIFNLNVRGEILYYLGAFVNHNLYFYNISNKKNIEPVGKIKEDIDKKFGSYTNFKNEFIDMANGLKGSGYTFLVKDRDDLKIINTSNEDSPYFYNFIPIVCLDLWEHAYYLEYQNNREAYINNFFNIIDFNKINIYYEKLFK